MTPKLKAIWENRTLILHGLVNRFFSTTDIRQMAKSRLEHCKVCPHNSKNAKKNGYTSPLPYKHCTKCGCSLALKPYAPGSQCPVSKWGSEKL